MSRVYYWSDLHFDARSVGTEKQVLKNFWKRISRINKDDLLILAGDYFNCWMNSIKFIKKCNKIGCKVLVVIGNHDYWNDVIQTKNRLVGIEDTNKIYRNKLKNHKNIVLLLTGTVFKWNNYYFIGDNGCQVNDLLELGSFHGMMQFITNPFDKLQVELISLHEKWLKFYNEMSKKYKNLVVVTHQPTWTWMKKEKLLPNVHYINGHDHYAIDGVHRMKGTNRLKTAPNNYNDGQNCNDGLCTELKHFDI